MLTLYDRALHLVVYSAQRLSAWGFERRLGAIVAITLANVAFGAAAYRFATGAPWPSALFTVYGVLLRAPGFTVRDAGPAGTFVLNAILLYSVFVFAVVLGAGIEEVKGRIAAVRSGEVGLRLQNHVLLLNWSPLVVPLLRQLAAARTDPASPLHRRTVVLLADAPKAALDAQLGEALKGIKIELYTFGGQPWRLGDLERVCAAEAACIILLEPLPPAIQAAGPGGSGGGVAVDSEASAGRGARDVTTAGVTAGARSGSAPADVHCGGSGGADGQQGTETGTASDAMRLQQALKAAALMALLSLLDPSSSTDTRRTCGGGPSATAPPSPRTGTLQQLLLPAAVRRRLAALIPLKWQGRRSAAAGSTPRVIVQVPSSGGTDYAHLVRRSANRGGARGLDITLAESSLNQSSLLDRLVAQTALHPGLASVAREALRQGPGSPAFRYATVDRRDLVSATVADAWMLCRAAGAWLVGVVSAADGSLVLNPPPGRTLNEGDQLVALARGAEILPRRASRRQAVLLTHVSAPSPTSTSQAEHLQTSATSPADGTVHDAAAPTASNTIAGCEDLPFGAGVLGTASSPETTWLPIRVIVAGCGAARRSGLLDGFKQHAPPGSSIVFVSADGGPCAEGAAGGNGLEGRRPSRPLPAEANSDSHASEVLCNAGDGEREEPARSNTAAAATGAPVPLSAVAVQHMQSTRPISAEALLAAGLAAADALVLTSTAGTTHLGTSSTQAADAQLLCELLAVQEALEALESSGIRTHGCDLGSDSGAEALDDPTALSRRFSSGGGVAWRRGSVGRGTDDAAGLAAAAGQLPRRGLHVVCLVRSYGLRRTAQAFLQGMTRRSFSFELLIADELVSAALVQIATHPTNGLVFERLLGQRRGGPQLKMIPAAAFGVGTNSSADGSPVAFGDVAEQLLLRWRAAAVGYRRADGRLMLAPSPDEVIAWEEGDELVIIKDEWMTEDLST